MKPKKEYFILGAVIVALSLYLILRSRDRTHYELPVIPEIARKEISKIEISKAETSIVLNKKGDTWRIGPHGYPSSDDKVKGMLDTIEKLSVTALVSESKNYERYDLHDDEKVTVKAWIGDNLKREFEVGKAASSYRHTFVKLAGDHRVYHARGNFRGRFDQTVDSLRDRTVLSFEQSEIQEIRITKGERSAVFGRTQVPVEVSAVQESEAQGQQPSTTETIWQSADGKEADESKLNSLLATLSKLRCEKYIDDRKKEDFQNPIYTLRLKGAQEYALSIFAKEDENAKSYPAISSENEYPFLLPGSQVDRIMTDPEDMVKKPEES